MIKRMIKCIGVAAFTHTMGDREGYVTLPIIRGPARGMRFKLDLRSFIEPAYLLGNYERQEVEFVARLCKPEWIVWDCGIYLGFYTALFAKMCRQVIAFEPDPANIQRTKENLERNNLSNVQLVEAAIGGPDSSVEFVVSKNTNSHLKSAYIGTDREDYATRERVDSIIRVKCMSLDEVIKEFPKPDLVKIDIEGAEGEALQYTERLCTEIKPNIIVELHNPECDKAAWEWAQKYGYSLTSIDRGERITRREEVGGTLFCSPGPD